MTRAGSQSGEGNFAFDVKATDASGCHTTLTFSLAVAPKEVDDTYAASGGNAGNTDSVGNTESVSERLQCRDEVTSSQQDKSNVLTPTLIDQVMESIEAILYTILNLHYTDIG